MENFFYQLYEPFTILLTREILVNAFIIWFLLILVYVLNHEYMREQLYDMPVHPGGIN